MNDIKHIPRVRAETFGALLVGDDFQESEVVYHSSLPTHFQAVVESVVLLVGVAVAGLYAAFAQLQSVAAFLADLRYGNHAELQGVTVRVVFQNGFAETQEVEIENMRVPRIAVYQPRIAAEKVAVPQREVAEVLQ